MPLGAHEFALYTGLVKDYFQATRNPFFALSACKNDGISSAGEGSGFLEHDTESSSNEDCQHGDLLFSPSFKSGLQLFLNCTNDEAIQIPPVAEDYLQKEVLQIEDLTDFELISRTELKNRDLKDIHDEFHSFRWLRLDLPLLPKSSLNTFHPKAMGNGSEVNTRLIFHHLLQERIEDHEFAETNANVWDGLFDAPSCENNILALVDTETIQAPHELEQYLGIFEESGVGGRSGNYGYRYLTSREVTPPLVKNISSPVVSPFLPSSSSCGISVSSLNDDQRVESETQYWEKQICALDAPHFPGASGTYLKSRSTNNASNSIDEEEPIELNFFASSPPGRRAVFPVKRRVSELCIETPLTPDPTSEPERKRPAPLLQDAQRLSRTLAKEDGWDLNLSSDIKSTENLDSILGTISLEASNLVTNEILNEPDSRIKLRVPTNLDDWDMPTPPWEEVNTDRNGIWKKMVYQIVGQFQNLISKHDFDQAVERLMWGGIGLLEQKLKWSPFPRRLGQVQIEEEVGSESDWTKWVSESEEKEGNGEIELGVHNPAHAFLFCRWDAAESRLLQDARKTEKSVPVPTKPTQPSIVSIPHNSILDITSNSESDQELWDLLDNFKSPTLQPPLLPTPTVARSTKPQLPHIHSSNLTPFKSKTSTQVDMMPPNAAEPADKSTVDWDELLNSWKEASPDSQQQQQKQPPQWNWGGGVALEQDRNVLMQVPSVFSTHFSASSALSQFLFTRGKGNLAGNEDGATGSTSSCSSSLQPSGSSTEVVGVNAQSWGSGGDSRVHSLVPSAVNSGGGGHMGLEGNSGKFTNSIGNTAKSQPPERTQNRMDLDNKDEAILQALRRRRNEGIIPEWVPRVRFPQKVSVILSTTLFELGSPWRELVKLLRELAVLVKTATTGSAIPSSSPGVNSLFVSSKPKSALRIVERDWSSSGCGSCVDEIPTSTSATGPIPSSSALRSGGPCGKVDSSREIKSDLLNASIPACTRVPAEPEILLSPTVGIILVSITLLRQKPLPSALSGTSPSRPDPSRLFPGCKIIQDRLMEVRWRYKRVIVAVCDDTVVATSSLWDIDPDNGDASQAAAIANMGLAAAITGKKSPLSKEGTAAQQRSGLEGSGNSHDAHRWWAIRPCLIPSFQPFTDPLMPAPPLNQNCEDGSAREGNSTSAKPKPSSATTTTTTTKFGKINVDMKEFKRAMDTLDVRSRDALQQLGAWVEAQNEGSGGEGGGEGNGNEQVVAMSSENTGAHTHHQNRHPHSRRPVTWRDFEGNSDCGGDEGDKLLPLRRQQSSHEDHEDADANEADTYFGPDGGGRECDSGPGLVGGGGGGLTDRDCVTSLRPGEWNRTESTKGRRREVGGAGGASSRKVNLRSQDDRSGHHHHGVMGASGTSRPPGVMEVVYVPGDRTTLAIWILRELAWERVQWP